MLAAGLGTLAVILSFLVYWFMFKTPEYYAMKMRYEEEGKRHEYRENC